MDWTTVAYALGGLGGLGVVMGVVLAIASVKLAVKVDPREERVRNALPGANCGACGYPGCDGYAAAVAKGDAPLNSCTVGGPDVVARIGEIMGQEVSAEEPPVAVLTCRGGKVNAHDRFEYSGTYNCRQAALLLGGPKACIYGCIGMGHCVGVCPVKAIAMGANNLPDIDGHKCVGCGACVRECPKGVLGLIPRQKLVYLACASHDRGKAVKQVCKVGCTACGLCAKNCPTGALTMVDNLPVMDFEKCIDCGICVHKCPTKSFIDRAKGRPKAVINPKCDGCQACVKACPFKAIEGAPSDGSLKGQPNKQHKVLADKCIGCGECRKVCPADAIDMVGALGHAKKSA